MTAALRLARPEDLDRLLPMVAAFHEEEGIDLDDAAQRAGVAPLLDGIPQGCIYLVGPARAPIGYVILTFGWSVEFGGMDAFVDEIYVRRAVRGRGIATEILSSLPRALAEGGVNAIHLEVSRDNEAAQKLYARAGFRVREKYVLMSRKL